MAGTHHRSHIMENVTLTPKEQSRLQVLNSLAAEHMTLDQAAELMGVTSRHTRRILAAYRECQFSWSLGRRFSRTSSHPGSAVN